ncbi:DUF4282 domain-containing protein [Brevibacterium spongiae]|uniref:DUF4282 domain-containing protein n=1 Tax=Brevibacterium spongiae TaxID=2909672 RepID=A0ABY5SK67_9MICO|nr:DUF4282 domain-containing protein [Brevibacterium spongiae]UVI34920.1 DUF4282 domain-containing protein [Brevibacterium spongiae]
MSTPQNPNDPNNDQPTPTEQTPDRPNAGSDEQGQDPQASQDPRDGQNLQSSQHSQAGHDSQPGFQQGTYDPSGYQAQAYQQGAYSQPDAYHQGAYTQPGAYQQGAEQHGYGQPTYAQPSYGQPAYGQAPQQASGQPGFFKSLFDIRFDNFIAVKWAGFIYIIAIVVAALSYIGTIIAGISAGIAAGSAASYFSDGPSFSVLPLILSIIFGWIIPALWVIGVRLVLELIVSNIKTAEHTKRIADSVSR